MVSPFISLGNLKDKMFNDRLTYKNKKGYSKLLEYFQGTKHDYRFGNTGGPPLPISLVLC